MQDRLLQGDIMTIAKPGVSKASGGNEQSGLVSNGCPAGCKDSVAEDVCKLRVERARAAEREQCSSSSLPAWQ
eukprot:scaffold650060_cov52-Prasinocladus_malaysianus.AAC.1